MKLPESEWHYYEDGTRTNRIKKYSFYEDRRTESSLFKIPETCKVEVLTYSGVKDELEEFIGVYNESKFDGLIFEKIYESNKYIL